MIGSNNCLERGIILNKKLNYVLNLFILLILLIEYRFFYLISFPDMIQKTMTYHNKVLVFLVSLGLFLCYGVYKKNVLFSKYVYSYIILIALSALFSYLKYQPNLNEIVLPLVAYLSIVLYFPMRRYLKNHTPFFINLLTWLNIIANVVMVIQLFYYRLTFKVFLHIYEFYSVGRIFTRDGDIRITYLGTIISFSCIVSIGIIFLKKSQYKLLKTDIKIHWLNILLSLIYFQFISQTRMYVIVILGTIFILMYVSVKSKNFIVNIIRQIMFFIVILLLVFYSGVLDYFRMLIQPFIDGSYIYDGSYYARLESLNYFSDVIKSNPLFGNGLLLPNAKSSYYNIITGPMGYAFYTDVGILGLTAQFGIPMLIWYLLLIKYIFKIYQINHNKIILSLVIFICLSSATLIVTDPQRITFLILSLSIIDGISNLFNKTNDTKIVMKDVHFEK